MKPAFGRGTATVATACLAYIKGTFVETIRCTHCNRKLAEAIYTQLNIKCPRCKTITQKATEPLQSDSKAKERPYAPPHKK
jgi:phage FluMu protein Com